MDEECKAKQFPLDIRNNKDKLTSAMLNIQHVDELRIKVCIILYHVSSFAYTFMMHRHAT